MCFLFIFTPVLRQSAITIHVAFRKFLIALLCSAGFTGNVGKRRI